MSGASLPGRMPDDEDWPPSSDRTPDDLDGNWQPPLNGQTRDEYLASQTPMAYQDIAANLADRQFGDADRFEDGRDYTADQFLHGIVYRFLLADDEVHDGVKDVIEPITSWHRLHSHLKSSPRVAALLGFEDDIPSGDTFRRYWEDLDPEDREFIREDVVGAYRSEIASIFREGGHPQQVYGDWDPEPQEIDIREKKDAIRHIRGLMNDVLDFDRDHTAMFDRELLLDIQATVSGTGESLDAVLEHLRDEADEDVPFTSGFFYNIRKRDAAEWNDLFESIYDTQIRAAQAAGFLAPDKDGWPTDDYVADGKFDAYVDATDIPFYQNKSGEKPKGVTGGSKTSGTHWGFTFCTLSSHAGNRSLHLASKPELEDTDYEEIVEYLLDRAEEYIDVEVVCIDSEYSGVDVLTMLEDRDQDFVIQYPKYDNIKKKVALLDEKYDKTPHVVDPQDSSKQTDELTLLVEPNYDENPPSDWDWGYDVSQSELAQVQFSDYTTDDDGNVQLEGKTLDEIAELLDLDDIPKEHHEYRRAYLTSLDVPEDEVRETIERYNKRWRIETKYRVVKDEFTPSTRTRYLRARNFFWSFSCALYNSWVLLDVFLRGDNPHLGSGEGHELRANRFMKYFSETDEDST